MNKTATGAALLLAVALGWQAMSQARAAGCVNGAYRAGCAGPNGAVGVRKAPYAARPVYRPRTVVVAPAPRPVVVVPPPRPVVVVPPPRAVVVAP